MKPHDIQEKMLKIISMDDDEFTQKLFFDDVFLTRYNSLEREYGRYLLKKGKKAGHLQLNPLSKEHSNHVVLVTSSTRKKEAWNRTVFLKGEPLSHREYDSLEELVNENIGDWFQHALWLATEDSNL